MELTLAHSPDADDAFMFAALSLGKVNTRGYTFRHVLADIESLNRAAWEGRYDVSAISFHAYPYVAQHYLLLTCGASVGDGYGPVVVARPEEPSVPSLVAVPGEWTTAYLALKLWHPKVETISLPFDRIGEAVKEGEVPAGLLIHEGQLTYGRDQLRLVVDLGRWWKERTGLPLPLGGNVLHRRHHGYASEIAAVLREAIACSLSHREECLNQALAYARGLSPEEADRFVGMYVNDWTLDLGEKGRRAVRLLLEEGYSQGIISQLPTLDWVN
ncbi:MqnA/MqnD/SBP family protein [Desulfothermobacter acidiphilus]|uniref:MqnA/MqnD/SBP family protein n=1 Tax=Desulfothermobacter acidiphilus TaxID=1938353 RepID=UPI003F88BA5C